MIISVLDTRTTERYVSENYGNAYGYGYGYGYGAPGYGYGVPHRWSSSHRHNKGHKGSKPQSTTPKVGGDWPKIEVP